MLSVEEEACIRGIDAATALADREQRGATAPLHGLWRALPSPLGSITGFPSSEYLYFLPRALIRPAHNAGAIFGGSGPDFEATVELHTDPPGFSPVYQDEDREAWTLDAGGLLLVGDARFSTMIAPSVGHMFDKVPTRAIRVVLSWTKLAHLENKNAVHNQDLIWIGARYANAIAAEILAEGFRSGQFWTASRGASRHLVVAALHTSLDSSWACVHHSSGLLLPSSGAITDQQISGALGRAVSGSDPTRVSLAQVILTQAFNIESSDTRDDVGIPILLCAMAAEIGAKSSLKMICTARGGQALAMWHKSFERIRPAVKIYDLPWTALGFVSLRDLYPLTWERLEALYATRNAIVHNGEAPDRLQVSQLMSAAREAVRFAENNAAAVIP